ncbi:putative RPL9A-ribosomal protein L9.e [Microstroma glucosiphilum]|uniref:Putative RPL9A-ribosomal protein L9.e n=1 Tax=Pseudomicrostroma glucosiphilum TaxID=1684307 RepID=A0A316UC18_9BASI|nr:putative RPL9A-ribosomal protein L9.e [Pseudomicrostroma glucosiphilum]PWN22770.1 putative RPL9A-ribosomal protein L9.e [Pseudomicrostroma glucosiphilum]
MLQIFKEVELAIPSDVTVTLHSRQATVKGPRGELTKHVKHMNMDIRMIKSPEGDKIKFIVWHGGRKHLACLRTAKAVFANMIKGVTVGFQYKCRAVYAHFPINMIIGDGGRSVEIRNFLGEKRVRHVEMRKGVTIKDDPAQKDQVLVEGNDIEEVSQSAADLHGQCLVKNKDIRKFLDGIYTSEKSTIVVTEE